MTKVVVGLSGGVDSSVAAYLLKQQGYDVLGVFMQNWEDDNDDEYCSIKQDSIDAIAVADKLQIDIEIVNFAKQYKDNVFNYFLKEYSSGRTPNPDILCNSEIKFKAFLDYAINIGADFIATGHYVGKKNIDAAFTLTKAFDLNKDQSYFLYRLNQYQISKSLFPLASITKPEVRKIAAKLDLATANKKDSTGICFIGERPFREFLQKYIPNKPGNIVTSDGKIIGQHLGLMYYTLGQRKGLGIGGLGEPWFVVDKKVNTNELIVVQGHNNPQLFKTELTASDLSFALNNKIEPGKYSAKTRYRMQDAKCEVSYINDNTLQLIFETPQWAVTPGQSVVIYDNELCLGGGIIN
jgi:tRNA-specific 2-thiouridylase